MGREEITPCLSLTEWILEQRSKGSHHEEMEILLRTLPEKTRLRIREEILLSKAKAPPKDLPPLDFEDMP